jgi:hypothetical protein
MNSIAAPTALSSPNPWIPCLISETSYRALAERGEAVAMQIVMQPAAPVASAERYSEPRTLAMWADAFDVDERTLRRWFAAGQVRAKKIGKLWCVHVVDIPMR